MIFGNPSSFVEPSHTGLTILKKQIYPFRYSGKKDAYSALHPEASLYLDTQVDLKVCR